MASGTALLALLENVRSGPDGSKFNYIDIKVFEDSEIPAVSSGELFEAGVEQWLAKRSMGSQKEGCSGGLRLLLQTLPQEVLDSTLNIGTSRPLFIKIVETFGLALDFARALKSDTGLYLKVEDSDKTEYILKPLSGAIEYINGVFSYDHATRITHGFLRTSFDNAASDLVRNLIESAQAASHPMLISVASIEYQVNKLYKLSSTVNKQVLRIELATGHTEINDPGDGAKPDNFQQMTIQLSQVSYRIAAGGLTTGCLDEILQFASECSDHFNRLQRQHRSHEENERAIQRRMRYVTSSSRHVRLKFTMLEKRAQFQLNTVYNLIAQQDRALNIEVAQDSKIIALASQRDSASMKTIAVLTTVFLPPTWVAAFLSMPLFDWDAASGPDVMTAWFWLYWALAIPLTIVVMASWWIWITFRDRRYMLQDQKARNGLSDPKRNGRIDQEKFSRGFGVRESSDSVPPPARGLEGMGPLLQLGTS